MRNIIIIEKEELKKLKDVIRIVMKDYTRDNLQKREKQISTEQFIDLMKFMESSRKMED